MVRVSHSARGYKCHNLGPLMISLKRFLSGWNDCTACLTTLKTSLD